MCPCARCVRERISTLERVLDRGTAARAGWSVTAYRSGTPKPRLGCSAPAGQWCALAESEKRLRDIPDEKRRLAAALRAGTIAERDRLAAFVLDEATAFAANPFPSTTAGAARQRWGLREIEFEAMQVAAAGLPCLMAALARLPAGEPLRQEILRTPAHVLYLLHHGESGRIVGAALHGKPREALPPFVRLKASPKAAPRRPRRRRVDPQQLDLFESHPA